MIRTAVDSVVLLDIFAADPTHGAASLQLLERCATEGALIACDVVWAEIRPRFATDHTLLEATATIDLLFEPLVLESALLAGEIWKHYRRQGGQRERMVPDFLIAAHAKTQADRLCTRDRGFYRKYFPKLTIVEP